MLPCPRLLAALLFAPLLVPQQEGPPPAVSRDAARAGIRARLRDLGRTMATLRWGTSIPREMPCITDQVNALLDAPREDLLEVLAASIRPPKEGEESPRDDGKALRIAAFLTGVPQTAERRFEGDYLRELHGFALVDYEGDGSYSSHGPQPPPPPEVVLSPGTRFRARLRPRPFDLLKEILAGEGDAREAGSRMMGGDFRLSAGLELGEAARKDPEFGKFLLTVCGESHEGEMESAVLTAALGRWAGPEAVAELTARLKRALLVEDESAWHRSVTAAAAALNSAGAEAAVAALLKEQVDKLPTDRRGAAERLIGGDAVVLGLLAKVEKEPTAENLGALANALNQADTPKESVAVRLRAFEAAIRIRRESGDAAVRGWALAVAQNSLWAGLYWRFGFMQGKNFSEDADREAPLPWGAKCETERDYFLGAWPDPEVQGAALKEDLAAGRIRPDSRWIGFAADSDRAGDIELWMDRARDEDPGVDVRGRREGDEVVLAIANRRKTPVAINTLAPRYAVAIMVPLTGEPKGRMELDLQACRVLPAYHLLAKLDVYRRIASGETYEMRFPTGKLPEGSRVLLSLRDEMEPDGDLEVPLIRRIWELTIR